MLKLTIVIVAITLFTLTLTGGSRLSSILPDGPPSKSPGAWADDFSGGKLSNRWMASTGGLGFSPQNVDLSHGMLGLRMTQTKGKDGSFVSSGAEVQSRETYGFGTYTWIMRSSSTALKPNAEGHARTGSSSGVFSFINNSSAEIDFEVEGSRPNVVWTVNWTKPHWSSKGYKLKTDSEFHTYQYVWSKDKIVYLVDNKVVRTIHDGEKFQVNVGGRIVKEFNEKVPQTPAYILMNHWGTKDVRWGGEPTEGTRYMWVKWFSFEPLK